MQNTLQPSAVGTGPVIATTPAHAQHVQVGTIQTDGVHLNNKELDLIGFGIFLLLVPLVLAFARRLWVRGGIATTNPLSAIETSPRMQRLEEAVDAIALEVERISESQRFTMKVLAERQPVSSLPPRKEPGSITPH